MPDVAKIFDRESENWDADHGPDSPRAFEFQARAAYLRALCETLGKPRVLDLGCGTGRQLLDLADLIDGGVGLDLFEGMIARAREHASTWFGLAMRQLISKPMTLALFVRRCSGNLI